MVGLRRGNGRSYGSENALIFWSVFDAHVLYMRGRPRKLQLPNAYILIN